MLDRSSNITYLSGMNKLPIDKRVQIINLLVEGSSIRAASRVANVSPVTVLKLLAEVGRACQKFHDEKVVDLSSKRLQCDEIWSFVYAKEKNKPANKEGAGDAWTWTAIDADSKLIVSWFVGSRDADSAHDFLSDVASRLKYRIQLTSDAYRVYINAVGDTFGSQIDYAQLVKIYGKNPSDNTAEKRYSPAECIGSEKRIVSGSPDVEHISTSYVERSNLTMRMHMRRFTRLTNAFSKKLENHFHAIALHFVYYNFVRVHKTLRVTPAMEAKLMKKPMTLEEIVKLTDI
jgi:IS1 family transposase